ncbi:MAG TPA: NAD-dependent epimerase/dehydratase family protein, partial [Gemmatimonadota bacterium]|nr:NAD-dependent epimerase/dehydratase family protein [Gemmatimonadota bacterium]
MSQSTQKRKVLLTGGTGFVGHHVARRLTERGHAIRALVRSAERANALRDLGAELVEGDVVDDIAGETLAGCDAVIHLVGIIREKPPALTFERVHTRGTLHVVEAAKSAGVKKFAHMSALGAAAQGTAYQRTKYEAEELVRRSGLPFVIFRPSVIVGTGGEFTNLLVSMVRRAPAVPVIGDGNYRLQPVDVGNMASAMVLAVERDDISGESYDIGGPHKLTYNRMLEIASEELGVRRKLFH